MLQLRRSARNGPIIDLAVTPTSVAVVGADYSVTIFTVPETWDQEDLEGTEVSYLAPSPNVPVSQVEWIQKHSSVCLAISTSRGIITLDKSTAASRDEWSIKELSNSIQMVVQQVRYSSLSLAVESVLTP